MRCLSCQTLAVAAAAALAAFQQPASGGEPTLREVFDNDFRVGVALNSGIITGRQAAAAEHAGKHFSSITAENDMKWRLLNPEPGRYQFRTADAYFDFAKKHAMEVIGHTLVWHSQTPAWVFEGPNGEPATREELLARMREHSPIFNSTTRRSKPSKRRSRHSPHLASR